MAKPQRKRISHNFKDRVGKRYGRLKVLSRGPNNRHGHVQWHCLCRCGTRCLINTNRLRKKETQSCGCLRKERATTHGLSRTVEYRAWVDIIQRCENPKYKSSHNYGGRGIKICRRWRRSFVDFLSDVGRRPSRKHSLDRFPDNNGDYRPGNVRWATSTQQRRNTRQNRLLTFRGRTACLAEWAQSTGLAYTTIAGRLQCGWSVEMALTVPAGSYRHPVKKTV